MEFGPYALQFRCVSDCIFFALFASTEVNVYVHHRDLSCRILGIIGKFYNCVYSFIIIVTVVEEKCPARLDCTNEYRCVVTYTNVRKFLS